MTWNLRQYDTIHHEAFFWDKLKTRVNCNNRWKVFQSRSFPKVSQGFIPCIPSVSVRCNVVYSTIDYDCVSWQTMYKYFIFFSVTFFHRNCFEVVFYKGYVVAQLVFCIHWWVGIYFAKLFKIILTCK